MASLITPQFERYVAEQTIARGTVQFDEFIFANIPGLNENNLAQYLTMPTSAQIVHRQAVSQSGVINENAVVYSVTIGTEVGDFDFNFIGLINRSKNLLAVAVQTDTVKKIRNKNAVQGNSITRNMLLEFSGAKALTGINVNANTWQIDFTVRLHGLDEKIRLTNRDLYGRAVFFDDSFLVKRKTGNQFTIQPGVAYVEGVRMDLTALYNLTANNLPCSVYADVVHHCTVTGEYQTEIKYLTQSKADYVDTANRQHYVQILADIDSQGNVTDRRLLSPFLGMNPLTLDDTTENTKDERGHTHKLPIASLVKKGIVKLFSGYDSDAEDMAATPKAIKGLKALIDAITRNLGNYIPNSKKSSAVNSNSAETVATSAAVKTANDNANGRVSKSGDTMTGDLTVPNIIVNDPTNNNNFVQIGDDTKLIDVDMGHTVGLQTTGNTNDAYIAYGATKKRFGFDGSRFSADSSISTAQYGHGAYASQYTSNAPYMVEESGSATRDTYHPFIKGRVRKHGQYGAAFSFGYTTRQGAGDGFGRGIIHLIEDNGRNITWNFEHNGDFYSAGDVSTSRGKSLNNSVQISELVGEVAFFARTTPPSGWLKANGAAVSRTTYAALFAAIGTTFGAGDGRTTFNLPDLRGEFLRCLDDGRNVDAGRRLGTAQGDAIRNITGAFDTSKGSWAQQFVDFAETSGAFDLIRGNKQWTGDPNNGGNNLPTGFKFDASRVVPTANENRPRNIALLACIKY
ncbi:phage tail-collar fiber domain-containing protein [Haemophilus haemolyticus]|uniref:phage tail-collar fiber domain-containing protein n=1 Tax=Haemophilus haemolyticus TaxID=726 RepID=UPI00112DD413|nr:phage tail protein [Haemophilus haemolyticus]TPH03933.1 phage tail protein [Haemophilus haemolyticus]